MYDHAGCIHIHTKYSFDANTGMAEIITAAQCRDLDFIVITDHDTLGARTDNWEGWHDGLLVIVGQEIAPSNNHYLALGTAEPIVAGDADTPQNYIDAVIRQGGIGLIAHPDHTGTALFGVKEYSWNDWSARGFAGISIWDLMTDWQEKLNSHVAALKAWFSPAWVLSGPKKETLQRWDRLNAAGKYAGFGEIDNHNSVEKCWGIPFRILPFATAFATIRTHVLTEKPLAPESDTAQRQILEAIRDCRMYVAHERWNKAAGFEFTVRGASGEAGIGGEYLLGGRSAEAIVALPSAGRIRLVCDGEKVAEGNGTRLNAPIDRPGVYRVEVFQKVWGAYKPWIFSNPVWVR